MKRLLVAGLLITVVLSASSTLREPTAAEHAAIEKMHHAIHDVYDSFTSADWQIMGDNIDDDIAVNTKPACPLDVNNDYHRSYGTPKDSQRAMTVLAPYEKQSEDAMARKDFESAVAAGKQEAVLAFISMETHINRNVVEAPAPSKPSDAQVPGAAFAYKVPEDICNWNDSASGQCWVIAFGNWKSAWNPKRHVYEYKFKHPVSTPYIENAVVTLRGAPDRIAEAFKLPVWNEIDEALAK